jgi:hypothetical protein
LAHQPNQDHRECGDREVIVPATGTASDSAIMPKVLNAVLGTKFKVILGYSTTDQRLAVERGEAEGVYPFFSIDPTFPNASLYSIITSPGVGNSPPATPVPAALPLFATGLGGLGLFGWRRKRKAQAVAA